MAFVLFWLQQHIFLFRHQNHVFLPASTTWLLFCSGINNKDNLSMKYSAATQEPSHARVTSVKSTTSLGDWVTGSDKKEEKFVLSIHLRMGLSRIDTIRPLYDHTFFPLNFLSLCFLKNIVLKLNQFLFLEKKNLVLWRKNKCSEKESILQYICWVLYQYWQVVRAMACKQEHHQFMYLYQNSLNIPMYIIS